MRESDRQGLTARRIRPWRAWLGTIALLAGLAGCRPQSSPSLTLDGVDIHIRGHREAEVLPDGSLLPLVLGRRDPVGLCLTPSPTRDTSQWEASLTLGGLPAPRPRFSSPAARMGTTLCFDLEIPEQLTARNVHLCGALRDRFDGAKVDLPCHEVRYEAEDTAYRTLMGAISTTLGEHAQDDPTALVQALDELAREARMVPFPFAGLQLDLIAVYYLVQTGGATELAAAAARLGNPPDWILDPAATHWAAQLAYEAGTSEIVPPRRLPFAWQRLRDAERAYLLVAHPNRITPVMKQAEVLALLGAVREAAQRLSGSLEECGKTPCSPHLLPVAKDLLAWLITLDPEASPSELQQAADLLDESLARSTTTEPLERANTLVNRAYLEQRAQRDPASFLRAARVLLEPLPDGYRAQQVDGWANLVAGLAALDQQDADRALALCGRLTHKTSSPDLAAWALSCAAKAHRLHGDLASARAAFARALLLHEHLSPGQLGQAIYLGPGQQADDTYQAARVEIELGQPKRAWELLRRLDRLAIEARQCLAQENGVATDPALQDRRQHLLQQLIALELPTSIQRRQQLEGIQRTLRQELLELARQRTAACTAQLLPTTDRSLRFRAFPLEDEIILLEQNAAHEITVHRRTPLARAERQQRIDDLERALAAASIDDDTWIRLIEPLATALAPAPDSDLGETTTFALHGSLQSVPLGALPRSKRRSSGAEATGPSWLGGATLPVLYSAASLYSATRAPLPGTRAASPPGRPLFVVDPRDNLPSGERLAAFYRELFPNGLILQGAAATRQALRGELSNARWLHIDAHGSYDPAFPELSSLLLADAQLPLLELGDLPEDLEIANLSACQTGRWPTTADSGHYGIAGIFARRGAWVIASRADLQDQLAADFNQVFYRALKQTDRFPAAFASALESLRQRYPAAAWASLFVLHNVQSAVEEGQNPSPRTPDEDKGLGISSDRPRPVREDRARPIHQGEST